MFRGSFHTSSHIILLYVCKTKHAVSAVAVLVLHAVLQVGFLSDGLTGRVCNITRRGVDTRHECEYDELLVGAFRNLPATPLARLSLFGLSQVAAGGGS